MIFDIVIHQSHCSYFAEYFLSEKNSSQQELLKTLEKLQTDSDRDVRYFSNPHPETTRIDDDQYEEEEEDEESVGGNDQVISSVNYSQSLITQTLLVV